MTRAAPRKRLKYGNRITVVDGIRFHSAGEARRWQELKLLERARKIEYLKRQQPLSLTTYRMAEKALIIVGSYIPDFCYYENGEWVYEDFKGFDTPLSRWKRKHAEAQYGIKIRLTGKR